MSAEIINIWLEDRPAGNTIGIDEACPRLSWTMTTPTTQTAVRLEMQDDSGQVQVHEAVTDRTSLLAWPFPPLSSRTSVSIRIAARQVGDTDYGLWSEPLRIEAGLLEDADWVTDFVSPSTRSEQGTLRPAYLLRAEWSPSDVGLAASAIRSARVYATAHGVYELELNGDSISDEILSPGWTSYKHRLRYQTHDVTAYIHDGVNAVGAWLADGWYRGRIGFDGGLWDVYGADVALLLQLELTSNEGIVYVVPLAGKWKTQVSPISQVGLYEGETYDATQHQTGWSLPAFEDHTWATASILPRHDFPAVLEAPTGPPIRVTETLRPISTEVRPGNRIRLDFGQNIAGKLRIRLTAPVGHTVRLHHAEVLEDDQLGIRPLRTATSIDTYVSSGTPDEEWAPRFTIHGFRYAEVENWPGDADTIDVEALVVHTDLTRTGWFDSSHPGLNKLHQNVVWSMRDNFVDIPTDCPQRDERAGWTGDIQIFAPTALFLYAAQGTLGGWLRDVAYEQEDLGHVPVFVPWIECGFPNFPTAAWGDAAVIVPWEIYWSNGDKEALRDQYSSMRAWVDLVHSLTHETGLWNEGHQLGDWLDPAAPPEDPGKSDTDKYLVATAYHIRTTRLVAQTALILGRDEDAAHYFDQARAATAAFQRAYVASGGLLLNETVTSLSLALVFDLLADDEQRSINGDRLIELVAESDYRISTGFVGTPIVCDALVLAGGLDAAYRLLLQDQLPSWLYTVSMGATTIWERWDSMLPDGSINPGHMTSFNHYALGAVADFLHRRVAGLEATAPGYQTIRVAPLPGEA